MPGIKTIRGRLRALANPELAVRSRRFFKTGPGEYGEGDRFLGIRVPVLRALAREYRDAPETAIVALLRSPLHEERLLALLVLVDRFRRGTEAVQARIFELYVELIEHVDGWDLVDTSAPDIIGGHLEHRDKSLLYELARSENLWSRRIAIMSTFRFVRHGAYIDTLAISELLLGDPEDLIHKAVGWMLREIGNRDRLAEEAFLRKHYHHMPRTMLRYAIEKFPEPKRKAYLNGSIKPARR